MPRIRNTIRELRAAREMTQQQLADRIDLTRQTAFRIAQVFGVPLEQVFQYEGKGKR